MFLAVGSAVAAEAVRRGIAVPERVRVDRSGHRASPGRARPGRAPRPGAGWACPRVRLVGTVGRIDYQKAPEIWVDAIAGLTATTCSRCGSGTGRMRKQMEARAAAGDCGPFPCTGHRGDVLELLPGLDVFAMASRYEGLPCAVVEAMAAGVPVVATAVNAVPDLVIPGETGLLVRPERRGCSRGAISYLLTSPPRRPGWPRRAGC